MRFFLPGTVAAICMMCGTASASLWFTGYTNPTNDYRYYAFTDWDTPLFGVGIEPDTDVYGVSAPAYRVDGHVIFEADGTGFATVIEATGSYASHPDVDLGSVWPVSFQFSQWFNSSNVPTSDTRSDYNANFLNFVSGQIVGGDVPEATTFAIWGGLGLCGAAVAYRSKRKMTV